jgi:hypothetical protein
MTNAAEASSQAVSPVSIRGIVTSVCRRIAHVCKRRTFPRDFTLVTGP